MIKKDIEKRKAEAMKTPKEKYLHDPRVATLVNYMFWLVKNKKFTPLEIKEAAILVNTSYKNKNQKFYVDDELPPKMFFLWPQKEDSDDD